MKKELKNQLLESLLYFSGMIKILKKQSKQKNLPSYEEYEKEFTNIQYLIKEVKKIKEE
jgi:hypothetical protein